MFFRLRFSESLNFTNKEMLNKFFFSQKIQLRFLFSILQCIQKVYSLKMYLKGYNYRIRLVNMRRVIRLELGYPMPLYIGIPSSIRIIKLRKKYYRFLGTEWSVLYRFCWYLRNLKSHFPYKRRGFILAREFPLRKIGKKSRRL